MDNSTSSVERSAFASTRCLHSPRQRAIISALSRRVFCAVICILLLLPEKNPCTHMAPSEAPPQHEMCLIWHHATASWQDGAFEHHPPAGMEMPNGHGATCEHLAFALGRGASEGPAEQVVGRIGRPARALAVVGRHEGVQASDADVLAADLGAVQGFDG